MPAEVPGGASSFHIKGRILLSIVKCAGFEQTESEALVTVITAGFGRFECERLLKPSGVELMNLLPTATIDIGVQRRHGGRELVHHGCIPLSAIYLHLTNEEQSWETWFGLFSSDTDIKSRDPLQVFRACIDMGKSNRPNQPRLLVKLQVMQTGQGKQGSPMAVHAAPGAQDPRPAMMSYPQQQQPQQQQVQQQQLQQQPQPQPLQHVAGRLGEPHMTPKRRIVTPLQQGGEQPLVRRLDPGIPPAAPPWRTPPGAESPCVGAASPSHTGQAPAQRVAAAAANLQTAPGGSVEWHARQGSRSNSEDVRLVVENVREAARARIAGASSVSPERFLQEQQSQPIRQSSGKLGADRAAAASAEEARKSGEELVRLSKMLSQAEQKQEDLRQKYDEQVRDFTALQAQDKARVSAEADFFNAVRPMLDKIGQPMRRESLGGNAVDNSRALFASVATALETAIKEVNAGAAHADNGAGQQDALRSSSKIAGVSILGPSAPGPGGHGLFYKPVKSDPVDCMLAATLLRNGVEPRDLEFARLEPGLYRVGGADGARVRCSIDQTRLVIQPASAEEDLSRLLPGASLGAMECSAFVSSAIAARGQGSGGNLGCRTAGTVA